MRYEQEEALTYGHRGWVDAGCIEGGPEVGGIRIDVYVHICTCRSHHVHMYVGNADLVRTDLR